MPAAARRTRSAARAAAAQGRAEDEAPKQRSRSKDRGGVSEEAGVGSAKREPSRPAPRARDVASAAAQGMEDGSRGRQQCRDDIPSATTRCASGKHPGWTYEQLCKEDPAYCKWVIDKAYTPNMADLRRFLQANEHLWRQGVAADEAAAKRMREEDDTETVQQNARARGVPQRTPPKQEIPRVTRAFPDAVDAVGSRSASTQPTDLTGA